MLLFDAERKKGNHNVRSKPARAYRRCFEKPVKGRGICSGAGNGSQTPFQNEFWNSEKIGIYVDIISGEPLFASVDKFDGHVGLPTFTKPISKDILIEVPDNTNEMRTQVRAKRSNARLGHVFPDPKSPTGQRYVVYSAAFHFVPVEQLKDRGYDAYVPLFDKK